MGFKTFNEQPVGSGPLRFVSRHRRMTAIFLDQNPWIVVLQPVEDYGLSRSIEFTPSPDQQFDLRPSNFRMRRA